MKKTYAKQSRESFFFDEATAVRVNNGPGLLEVPDFFSADNRQSATPLVHVAEALVNKRDEQVDEDVHAENVPHDEQCASPLGTATRAFKILIIAASDTVRWSHRGIVFHNRVPPFSATHPEKQNKRFRDATEVEVVVFL